jgi:hypothetical protein
MLPDFSAQFRPRYVWKQHDAPSLVVDDVLAMDCRSWLDEIPICDFDPAGAKTPAGRVNGWKSEPPLLAGGPNPLIKLDHGHEEVGSLIVRGLPGEQKLNCIRSI